jgi:hypothetical protein
MRIGIVANLIKEKLVLIAPSNQAVAKATGLSILEVIQLRQEIMGLREEVLNSARFSQITNAIDPKFNEALKAGDGIGIADLTKLISEYTLESSTQNSDKKDKNLSDNVLKVLAAIKDPHNLKNLTNFFAFIEQAQEVKESQTKQQLPAATTENAVVGSGGVAAAVQKKEENQKNSSVQAIIELNQKILEALQKAKQSEKLASAPEPVTASQAETQKGKVNTK